MAAEVLAVEVLAAEVDEEGEEEDGGSEMKVLPIWWLVSSQNRTRGATMDFINIVFLSEGVSLKGCF